MLEEKKMKRTIKDFDLEGKKIIIRCDLMFLLKMVLLLMIRELLLVLGQLNML